LREVFLPLAELRGLPPRRNQPASTPSPGMSTSDSGDGVSMTDSSQLWVF